MTALPPVLPGDVSALARVLLRAPAAQRPMLARAVLREARTAARHCARTGRSHPLLGNGTLMAAAMIRPQAPEPYWSDPDYLDCLIETLGALREDLLPRPTQVGLGHQVIRV